jgi:hypothetical protein
MWRKRPDRAGCAASVDFHAILTPDSEAQLNAWDSAWQTPPMKDVARRSMVIAGLKARLDPLGFAFASESEESFRFTRPLKLGGGYQIVNAALNFRLGLMVVSERAHQIDIQRGAKPEAATLDCKGPNGMVVLQDMERVSDYWSWSSSWRAGSLGTPCIRTYLPSLATALSTRLADRSERQSAARIGLTRFTRYSTDEIQPQDCRRFRRHHIQLRFPGLARD